MVGSTIPHEVIGVFGGGRILMKPAVEGSGVALVDQFVPYWN